ncbi:MAG TPA: (2Fe-2S)-binding protein [Castellaniella sp.]|uniref:(2Fe-2S)-binding protein n=1 Tax=Castellaniella sp. TaxID=1955812 RepID=UPI002EF84E23
MYICICNAVNEQQVQEAIAHGARNLHDLRAELGVGNCCGRCARSARDYLAARTAQVQTPIAAALPDLGALKVVELSRSPAQRVA